MNEPQLFVICNNCGREVSPYVTECPYCGKRLRKRAPDLPKNRERDRQKVRRQLGFRGGTKKATRPRASRPAKPKLSFESTRPKVTISLILLSVILSIAARVNGFPIGDLIAIEPLDTRWWTLLTSPLFHDFGYGFIALVAIAVFGSSLEERIGSWRLLSLWLVSGASGVALQLAMPGIDVVAGANSIALAMLIAWVSMMRAQNEEFDRYGVLAIGAAVLALPLVAPEAGVGAATAGVIVGFTAGMWLGRGERASD